jgi:hypothetical protein
MSLAGVSRKEQIVLANEPFWAGKPAFVHNRNGPSRQRVPYPRAIDGFTEAIVCRFIAFWSGRSNLAIKSSDYLSLGNIDDHSAPASSFSFLYFCLHTKIYVHTTGSQFSSRSDLLALFHHHIT